MGAKRLETVNRGFRCQACGSKCEEAFTTSHIQYHFQPIRADRGSQIGMGIGGVEFLIHHEKKVIVDRTLPVKGEFERWHPTQ